MFLNEMPGTPATSNDYADLIATKAIAIELRCGRPGKTCPHSPTLHDWKTGRKFGLESRPDEATFAT